MMRLDDAIARLSLLVWNAAGMKASGGRTLTVDDFNPYAEEQEASPETILKIMKGG